MNEKKKKKRVRKNRKWIPYKQLTPEEREQLRRDSSRKQLRKELFERKLNVSAAITSGDYTYVSNDPKPTNEDYLYVDIHNQIPTKWDLTNSQEEEEFNDIGHNDHSPTCFVDPDNIFEDKLIQEESITSKIQRQHLEIKKLQLKNEQLQEELHEMESLMKQYAAQL